MINIDELIKNALKSRNNIELRTYTNLKSEIQLLKTAKDAKPYDEIAEIKLISKMCKKLEDAISQFKEADRQDLIDDYTAELEILKKFIPESVNESEIRSFIESDEIYFDKFYTVVEEYIGTTQYTHMEMIIPKREMGNTIKYLKEKFPTVDGKLISDIVKSYVKY